MPPVFLDCYYFSDIKKNSLQINRNNQLIYSIRLETASKNVIFYYFWADFW